MRTVSTFILTLMLLLTLAACGGKEDVPTDPAGETATTEEQAAAGDEAATQDETTDAASTDNGDVSVVDALPDDPIGEVVLQNDRVLELTKLEKIGGHYYMYIKGKLNGRSSTVISFTRVDDIRYWKGISFAGPNNFMIVTGKDKQLKFLDSFIYIGNDTPDTFTFHTLKEGSFSTEIVTIPKKDVKRITFNQLKED